MSLLEFLAFPGKLKGVPFSAPVLEGHIKCFGVFCLAFVPGCFLNRAFFALLLYLDYGTKILVL